MTENELTRVRQERADLEAHIGLMTLASLLFAVFLLVVGAGLAYSAIRYAGLPAESCRVVDYSASLVLKICYQTSGPPGWLAVAVGAVFAAICWAVAVGVVWTVSRPDVDSQGWR